jgi:predicted kinase
MDKSDSAVDRGIYSKEATEKTYTKLYTLADHILRNHWNVIVDATFLKQEHRKNFRQLAAEHQVPFIIMDCQADIKSLQQRVSSRARETTTISEANLEVLQHQIESAQAFTDEEQPYIVSVDTEQALDVEQLVSQITNNREK